jgi:hypothetical protein
MNIENTKFHTGPSAEIGRKLVWVSHVCSECNKEYDCDNCSEQFDDSIPESTTTEEMLDFLDSCDEYIKCLNC